MRYLITGANGQLGNDVIDELKKRGYDYLGTDIDNMDITNQDEVEKVILAYNPNVIIHCAAWTAVDLAEKEENIEKVKNINHIGTQNIARTAKKIDAKMIYISTDYVFEGNGNVPYTPDQKNYNPISIYGKTKLDGELEVSSILEKYYIVRIAWVFGENGNNFVKTMLSLAQKYSELKVVDDQIGTPTYTPDLSKLLVDMSETEKYGYYHATNEGGYISWADFAEEIFKQSNYDIKVNRVTTKEYGVSLAKRPFNSRLDKSKLVENGFKLLPNWKDALSRYLCLQNLDQKK